MLDTQSNSNARERRVSLSRTGSENGDAEEAPDIFRAELVRDDHHQAGQPSRQRRGSVHVPGMVMEEGGNDNDSDAAARLKAAHRSGTNLSVPGASDSHTSALQTGARRRSFQTSSSRKSVSHADGGGAKATPTPPASPIPAAHPHDVRRPNSVSGSHTAGSATVVSTSLSRAKRIHASRLEDQILGHNSSHVTDTDYVRRIDATGHVSFIKAEEATFLERLRHNVRTASLGMGGRLIFVLTFCFLVSVVMAAYNFSLMSDDYFKSLSSYYARQHAQVTRDCALSIFAELAQVSPALATLSVTSAVLSAQSSAHACDSGLMRNVALKMPSALSSRYDSGPDLTALNAALDDYAISYNLYSTTLNQTGTSNSPMDENSINYFAVVIDNLMVNLARPLTERMQLSHTRFAAQRLTDVLQFAGVPARFLAPAVLWASFVNGPYINTTAGNPTASQSSSQLTSIGFPTTTAYIDALRRMNGIIAPVVNTFTYSSSPKTSNPLDDLYTFMQLDITNITVANFAPASSTPASRANQVYGYVTQAAPVTETFDVEPTSDIAWVVLVLPLIVLIVICFVVYTVGRRYQQRANRTLQLEIAQRSALQRAISAFVPRDFLGLMGYESIRNIRVGDHREVELTMIFFGVHNYTMLSSDASASKMFLLQQNLMTTAVSVSTRNGGFLDKFLGDGAFILFADALAAVIASVELVQESQDLAVRKRKGANNNKRSHTGHSDSMSSPSVSRENSTVSRGSESRSATKPKKPKANAKLYAQALQEVPFVEEDEEDDPKAKSQGSPQLQRSRRRSEGPMSDNDSIEMDDSPRREGDELADMESSGRTTDSSDLVKFNRREARNRISNAALPTTVIPDNDRCRVGVGIHTGLVCVGILGDSKRHSCTLISSKVNLASRLCKLTQKLRVNILLSRDVYDACGEEIEEEVGHYLRPLGTVKVYGQKKECDILEVFATDPAEVREYKISTAALWRKGQDHRTNLQFDESQEVFRTIRSECLAIVPSTVKGVDGLPFVDIPLDLHVKSRQRHHVFTEK